MEIHMTIKELLANYHSADYVEFTDSVYDVLGQFEIEDNSASVAALKEYEFDEFFPVNSTIRIIVNIGGRLTQELSEEFLGYTDDDAEWLCVQDIYNVIGNYDGELDERVADLLNKIR